jgi:hypothetical protein
MSNAEWITTLFAQPHMQNVSLEANYLAKWFYIKHGRAFYNPKQAECANRIEFKVFVLNACFEHIHDFQAK